MLVVLSPGTFLPLAASPSQCLWGGWAPSIHLHFGVVTPLCFRMLTFKWLVSNKSRLLGSCKDMLITFKSPKWGAGSLRQGTKAQKQIFSTEDGRGSSSPPHQPSPLGGIPLVMTHHRDVMSSLFKSGCVFPCYINKNLLGRCVYALGDI